MTSKINVKRYTREIDAGHGIQVVVFVDGKCTYQSISPKGNGWYTGDGNPEFIGMTPRQIGMKANRFTRDRAQARVEELWLCGAYDNE